MALSTSAKHEGGKDKVPRKRKSHGAGEGEAREEANRKRAKKKEAEKAGWDAANQQQQAIGKKGSTIQQLLSRSLSSLQLLTWHQVGML